MITTRVIGLDSLQEDINDLMLKWEATAERTMNFIAQSTAQRAKNIIRNSVPAGHVHFREHPDRYVRASAPGQPPAIDLGNLLESISFTKATKFKDSAYAYAGAYYAADLEFGTDQIAPRPFFTPAMEAAIEAGDKKLAKEFNALK
jgi:HK97 gp10 family phage protein